MHSRKHPGAHAGLYDSKNKIATKNNAVKPTNMKLKIMLFSKLILNLELVHCDKNAVKHAIIPMMTMEKPVMRPTAWLENEAAPLIKKVIPKTPPMIRSATLNRVFLTSTRPLFSSGIV